MSATFLSSPNMPGEIQAFCCKQSILVSDTETKFTLN